MAHVSLITLAVDDLDRATRFHEAMGWSRSAASVDGEVSFLRGGAMVLGLFGRADLADDAGVDGTGSAPTSSLAMNLPSPAAVDDTMAAAAAAGARITQPARATDWGGYAGSFLDPDGHVWEVAHNPGFPLLHDGRVRLPDEPASANDGVLASLMDSFDQTRDQLLARLDGLEDAEYLWEPAPGCWTVRPADDGPVADFVEEEELDPAPFTTIAWRMWHVAVDCLDHYSGRAFGASGTGLEGRRFVLAAGEATELVARALANFRAGMEGRGEAGMDDVLGPDWGPYGDHAYRDLFLHALREVTHHGAEIAVLRDLYRARG